jgi:hypothetical protein
LKLSFINSFNKFCFTYIKGLATVKYIYGPSTVNVENYNVIGSSISGRVEAGIGIDRLTTIIMPMKG